MDKKVLKALQLCPLFEGLTADEIEQTMQNVSYRFVSFDKHDLYVLAGMPCRYADIIIDGEITARMGGSSSKFIQMASLKIGSLMAPAFIYAKDKTMPVSVETVRKTTFLRMTPEILHQLMKQDDRILINFIRQLSAISSFLARKVHILSLHTVREKVAIFLLEEARRNNSLSFTLKKSRQEIADSFAIRKFSLQRCMKEFADEGAIALDGKNVTILNKQQILSHAKIVG